MAKKTDIKICRYEHCKHPSKEIDTSTEEYIANGSMYFHKDCLAAKRNGEWKNEKEKADLQLIKNLWVEHISNTVVYSQLFRCLNDLLSRGIESEYLVFVMNYCIEHKLNLRYPLGFKYFVDKQEIKNAYKKKNMAKFKVDQSSFSVTDTDDSPKFTINHKETGFKRILGGNK